MRDTAGGTDLPRSPELTGSVVVLEPSDALKQVGKVAVPEWRPAPHVFSVMPSGFAHQGEMPNCCSASVYDPGYEAQDRCGVG